MDRSKVLNQSDMLLSEAELMQDHEAGLWANYYGFADADELKEWGEQMERKRLAEIASKVNDQ